MIRYAVTNEAIMATTNAQRQAAYRAKHLQGVEGQGERLNIVISAQAKRSLERLASCYGVTQRAMIERLLLEAEHAAIDAAVAIPNGQADFYAGTLLLKQDSVTA
jgi:hypothetical protein